MVYPKPNAHCKHVVAPLEEAWMHTTARKKLSKYKHCVRSCAAVMATKLLKQLLPHSYCCEILPHTSMFYSSNLNLLLSHTYYVFSFVIWVSLSRYHAGIYITMSWLEPFQKLGRTWTDFKICTSPLVYQRFQIFKALAHNEVSECFNVGIQTTAAQ